MPYISVMGMSSQDDIPQFTENPCIKLMEEHFSQQMEDIKSRILSQAGIDPKLLKPYQKYALNKFRQHMRENK